VEKLGLMNQGERFLSLSYPSDSHRLTYFPSFGAFLLPLVPSPGEQCLPTAQPMPRSPSVSDSMIGRATSVNEDRNRPCNTISNPDEDFDAAIGQAYACIQGWRPEEIILSEKLSERDGELLDGRMCNGLPC
jgi:hypothetical protein